MGVLIITHYQRILHIVKPQFVHIMFEGRIVKEGGPELVDRAREHGYGWIRDEVAAAAMSLAGPCLRRVPGPLAGGSGLPRHGGDVADRAAALEAMDALLRDLPRVDPPRRLRDRRGGHRRLRGRARQGRRVHRTRRPARPSSPATRPRRSTSSPTPGAARTWARTTSWCSRRWSTTPTSSRGSCSAAGWPTCRSPTRACWTSTRSTSCWRRAEARHRRPRLQRARHDQPDRRDRRARARRRRAGDGRRRPGRAAPPGRRRRARRRLLRLDRPQGLRPDRHRRPARAARAAARRCRPSSAAGT